MKRPHNSAFTLVELLVVIGIIGLLISILLPTMTRARAEAKRAVCLSNLRTLGQCYQAYVNENRGQGLFTQYTVAPPTGATSATSYWFAGNANYGGTWKWELQDGYLAKFFKNQAFLSCPTASEYFKSYTGVSASPLANFATMPLTTYAYNKNLIAAAAIRSSSSIKNASETCALVDSVTLQNDTTGTMTGVLDAASPYVNQFGTVNNKTPNLHGRHAGRGAVLWYDGHATTEAPFITTLSSNLAPGTAWDQPAGKTTMRRAKIGYLTPYVGPESDLMTGLTSGTSNVSYYFWADKSARK